MLLLSAAVCVLLIIAIFPSSNSFAATPELSKEPLPEQINFRHLLENQDVAFGEITVFF